VDEITIRRRTVKGWTFKDLPEHEQQAIRAFLAGGPVPAGYERRYALEQRIAGQEGGDSHGPRP
jgi:hypothetical protein